MLFVHLFAFVSTSFLLVKGQGTCARNYTVVANDTCDSIGAAQKAPSAQIIAANPNISPDCSNLPVGQSICLGLTGKDCQAVYQVQQSDSQSDCAGVAKSASIPLDTFMANNLNIDQNCSNLNVGMVVCISKQKIVARKFINNSGGSGNPTSSGGTGSTGNSTTSAPASGSTGGSSSNASGDSGTDGTAANGSSAGSANSPAGAAGTSAGSMAGSNTGSEGM